MAKGQSARKSKKQPSPTSNPKTKSKGYAISADASSPISQCWNFWLDSPTPAVQNTNIGTPVVGLVTRGQVPVVQGPEVVLGFAPIDVSIEMIEAISNAGLSQL